MKKQQILTIAATIIAVLLVAGGTITLLTYLNDKKDTTTSPHEEEQAVSPENAQPQDTIDQAANAKAKALDEEAGRLLETDPLTAESKYMAAKEAYITAGNLNKAGEMGANAMTAKAKAEETSQ